MKASFFVSLVLSAGIFAFSPERTVIVSPGIGTAGKLLPRTPYVVTFRNNSTSTIASVTLSDDDETVTFTSVAPSTTTTAYSFTAPTVYGCQLTFSGRHPAGTLRFISAGTDPAISGGVLANATNPPGLATYFVPTDGGEWQYN